MVVRNTNNTILISRPWWVLEGTAGVDAMLPDERSAVSSPNSC